MTRKIICLFVSCLICFFSLPPPALAVADISVENGSFETWNSTGSTASGWAVSARSGTVRAEAENTVDGNFALQFTSTASQKTEMSASQSVTGLSAGTLYEVSAGFNLPEKLSSGRGFSVYVKSAGGSVLSAAGAPVSNTDGEWLYISQLFTAPSDGTVSVILAFTPDGSAQRTILIDRVEIRETEKGKMELYNSPVGYVLPGVVLSEADVPEKLPAFACGSAALYGAGETNGKIVRFIYAAGSMALIAGYSESGTELEDLHCSQEKTTAYGGTVISASGMVKGFWLKNGVMQTETQGAALTFKTPQARKNIIPNGDFEGFFSTKPYAWKVFGSGGEGAIEPETDGNNHHLRLEIPASGSVYAQQEFSATPFTTYRFSVDTVQRNATGDVDASFTMYFYAGDGTCVGTKLGSLPKTTNNHSFEVETPVKTEEIQLLLRLQGKGKVYFDNAFMECVKAPGIGEIFTDEFFYYEDWTEGMATVKANDGIYGALSEGTVDFYLKEGEAVLESKENVNLQAGQAEWVFSTMKMVEDKTYKVKAVLADKGGKNYGTCEKEIYRYNRPTALNKNGDFLDENGNLFIPHIMYHVTDYGINGGFDGEAKAEQALYEYDLLKNAGYNTVQMSPGCIYSAEYTKTTLDKLHSLGMKAMVPLYDGFIAPGNPARAAKIKKFLEEIHDHPAIFAYGVMDEPSLGKNGLTEKDLIDSYRLIRDIDKVHPTFTVIAPSSHSAVFTDGQRASMIQKEITGYTDVLCYDPYVACWDDVMSTYVYEVHKAADEFISHDRPCYTLNQVFDWRGYFPTADEYRHMYYQAVIGGSKGVGAYSFYDALGGEKPGLWNHEIWEDITSFGADEMNLAEKYFHSGTYPIFNTGKTKDYLYMAFKDGADIYMFVLRLDETRATASRDNRGAVDVQIPLVSADGKTSIGSYSAELLYGAPKKTVMGSGALNISLSWRTVLVYKISPTK